MKINISYTNGIKFDSKYWITCNNDYNNLNQYRTILSQYILYYFTSLSRSVKGLMDNQ